LDWDILSTNNIFFDKELDAEFKEKVLNFLECIEDGSSTTDDEDSDSEDYEE